MPKVRRSPNRPGRPAPDKTLTPQLVAEAALRLIDTEGLAEFSMRRLGQNLGVEAMALYNHFTDKDAIVDAVASLTFTRVTLPSPTGPWRARMKQLSLSVRRIALEHPNLFRLAMTRPTPPTLSLPLVEAALAALSDAGFDRETQVNAYHTCFHYILGFGLWEIEEHWRRSHDATAPAQVMQQYPRIGESWTRIFVPDLDRQFEEGLDIILRGLCPA